MFPHALAALVEPPLLIARIVSQERDAYIISRSTANGIQRQGIARLSGALRRDAYDSADLPVVGDYVALDVFADGSDAVIRHLLPRNNALKRRSAGTSGAAQPIAANLDTLFVTVALNRDFNLRRIERYVAGALACGVAPAILLTKIDLVDDVAAYVNAAASVAGEAPVVALCALDGRGLEALAEFRGPERTLAFVGSSGVGKSTLVNALLGENVLATGSVREDDTRGRHTTTRRQLLSLPDGTSVIDTPGMREFALADAEDGVVAAFDDVTSLAASCRFRDCRHEREPGCAVIGGLDQERLESFRKLTREAAFEARKGNHAAYLAEKQRWKIIHKSARAFDKRGDR